MFLDQKHLHRHFLLDVFFSRFPTRGVVALHACLTLDSLISQSAHSPVDMQGPGDPWFAWFDFTIPPRSPVISSERQRISGGIGETQRTYVLPCCVVCDTKQTLSVHEFSETLEKSSCLHFVDG